MGFFLGGGGIFGGGEEVLAGFLRICCVGAAMGRGIGGFFEDSFENWPDASGCLVFMTKLRHGTVGFFGIFRDF